MTTDTARTPVLEAKQVCAGYGAVEVVKDLDLVVHAGEVVALLGVNGAGKTTIVRALSGQLKPSGGEVWLKGGRRPHRCTRGSATACASSPRTARSSWD